MGGCSAPHCKNRHQDFVLYSLPRDRERRAKWVNNAVQSHPHWIPRQYSRFCEVHFDAFQWIKYRKLKPDAVPTIFSSCKNLVIQRSGDPDVQDHQYFAKPKSESEDDHQYSAKPRRKRVKLCSSVLSDQTKPSDKKSKDRLEELPQSETYNLTDHSPVPHGDVQEVLDLVSLKESLKYQVALLTRQLLEAKRELYELEMRKMCHYN